MGWGVIASLAWHAWSMLRNRSWGGVGCDSIVDLARMVDATQQMGWWGGRMCSIAEISDTVLVPFGMFYLH